MEALRIQPTFAVAWSNLASLFMDAGDLNRALQYYKVWNTLNRFAYYIIQSFGFVFAITIFVIQSSHIQEAVKLKPNFSDAYLNMGNVYKVRPSALC